MPYDQNKLQWKEKKKRGWEGKLQQQQTDITASQASDVHSEQFGLFLFKACKFTKFYELS